MIMMEEYSFLKRKQIHHLVHYLVGSPWVKIDSKVTQSTGHTDLWGYVNQINPSPLEV